MSVLIGIQNFLAGNDVAIDASSEDVLYVIENLYNGRPSKPLRFTGVGAALNPEWICIEFDAPKLVTLAAIFNHNLTDLSAVGDELSFKGCDDGCGSGGCDWNIPDYEVDLAGRLVADWNDLYQLVNQTRLAYRVDFIDTTNPAGFVEVGELFLGQYTALTTAHLKPGRTESPLYYRWKNVTPYGQHWAESLSYSVSLGLTVTNLGDPNVVDAVRVVLQAIHAANGRFVIIPNDRHPFAYYVYLENDSGFMSQVARGFECEANEWTFELMTLTKGIRLL